MIYLDFLTIFLIVITVFTGMILVALTFVLIVVLKDLMLDESTVFDWVQSIKKWYKEKDLRRQQRKEKKNSE